MNRLAARRRQARLQHEKTGSEESQAGKPSLGLSFRTSRRVKGKLKKIAVPATFDLVLLGNGRATGMLIFVFVNAKRISAAYEQTVAGLMAQRLAKDPAASS